MTKKASKKGGSVALVPKAEVAVAHAPATAATRPAETTTAIGPRGGQPGKRVDRAISITLKVSPAQYKMLHEARGDDNVTMQTMLATAVRFYFEKARGTKF